MMRTVDVIILSWDRLDDTIAAIKSALVQQDVLLQVVIVDQGSKPENLARLKEFCATDPRITLLCNQLNNGVTGGRNQASFAGAGEFIVALDNDAEFDTPFELQKMIAVMDENSIVGVVAFRVMCFGQDCDDASSWPYSRTPDGHSETIFKTNRFVGAGHAIRRNLFEKINGYDEKLFFMHEEVDFAKRCINAGYEILYYPSIIVRHKVSAEHRVAWNGKRFYYDMRNRTYLHIKHKTFLLTFIFHTALLFYRGIKRGYTIPALQGLGSAILLIPHAIGQWFSNPYLNSNERANHYFQSCDPLYGQSLWQRIQFRIKDAIR